MLRIRFKVADPDYRPITFPPPWPWWCTGSAHDESYSVLVAYAESESQLLEFWPDATDLDADETDEITFTSRFPAPDWWQDKGVFPVITMEKG